MQQTTQIPDVESRMTLAYRLIDEEYDAGLSQGFDSEGTAEHQRNELKTLVGHGQISFAQLTEMLGEMRALRQRQGFRGPGNKTPKSETEYQMWKDDYAKRQEAELDALLAEVFGPDYTVH